MNSLRFAISLLVLFLFTSFQALALNTFGNTPPPLTTGSTSPKLPSPSLTTSSPPTSSSSASSGASNFSGDSKAACEKAIAQSIFKTGTCTLGGSCVSGCGAPNGTTCKSTSPTKWGACLSGPPAPSASALPATVIIANKNAPAINTLKNASPPPFGSPRSKPAGSAVSTANFVDSTQIGCESAVAAKGFKGSCTKGGGCGVSCGIPNGTTCLSANPTLWGACLPSTADGKPPTASSAKGSCDAQHPSPAWGVKDGKCLPSCNAKGGLGGGSYSEPCLGLADLGPTYDAPYCCRRFSNSCDDKRLHPDWGDKDGTCVASCGGIGGTSSFDDACTNHGKFDAGIAYDVKFCCKDSPGANACKADQPAPNWKSIEGKCMPSCAQIGGTTIKADPCAAFKDDNGQKYLADAGKSFDPGFCCKPIDKPSAAGYCDDEHKAPDWGPKNGKCLKSCGALAGPSATSREDECGNYAGLMDAGPAYDVKFCCKAKQSDPTASGNSNAERGGDGRDGSGPN